MRPHVTLITLGVGDLAIARAFYLEGLGWEPLLDLPEVVFFQVGHGLVLGLFPQVSLDADIGVAVPEGKPARDLTGFTLAHNVDSEAEVDAAVARAVEAGATVLKAPQIAAFGGYHAYIADPDGFRWEIAYNPGLHALPDGRVGFRTCPRVRERMNLGGIVAGRLPPDGPPPTGERFVELARVGATRVELIVSSASPDTAEQRQAHDEWVLLLEGSATLEVAGTRVDLEPGSWIRLPAGTPHRVVHTDAGSRWLAVHAPEPATANASTTSGGARPD